MKAYFYRLDKVAFSNFNLWFILLERKHSEMEFKLSNKLLMRKNVSSDIITLQFVMLTM